MDDFYIISSDKLLLRRILKEIEDYIKPLGLRLNNKTQIFPLKNGIDFLGFTPTSRARARWSEK